MQRRADVSEAPGLRKQALDLLFFEEAEE